MSLVGAADVGHGRRITLLAGQAFTLGLTMAWLLVPASAIFLDEYGSSLLPVTYIGAAVAGAASSAALGAALRRRPIASIAGEVLVGLVLALLLSWVLLWQTGAAWVSFALLVLVPIVVPIGFLFLVGQAGALLDVRALKALYARVVAGFALGFVAGGLGAPLLLATLGATEHLLAAAAAASATFLALLAATRRKFPDELSAVEHAEAGVRRPTVRAALRDRYVALIVAFQMLSAVESQWLDYLVFDRAAQRYDDPDELARFVSRFTAIAYGADIIFLLALAGLLLRRFGLRYGLTANPGAVLVLLGAIAVAASLHGSGATPVFVLVVAARVTDLAFSDGAARTSLSAAYQAVPSSARQVVQAAVEGLAVPLAIGASGVGLLILRSTVGTDGLALPVLTSTVVLAWAVVAVGVYRRYRVSLLDSLRHRELDPAELSVDDANSLPVLDRLLDSDDLRDVRLGLDTLELGEHPALADRLRRLATDPRDAVRVDALGRLVRHDAAAAVVAARDGLDDPRPAVRAACVRALGVAGGPSDATELARRAGDPAPEVKAAVAGAVARLGGDAVAAVAAEITRLAGAGSPADRITAAQMLGEAHDRVDRTWLRDLVGDRDCDVANAALASTIWPLDAGLLDGVVGALRERRTAGAAVDALVRAGDLALPAIDGAFGDQRLGRRVHELLARACRQMGGPSAIAVLRRQVDHRDREVGLAVMTALAALVTRSISPAGETHVPVDGDLEHACRVLRALAALDDDPAAAVLCTALRDELDLARARVVAALSISHGAEAMGRVAFQLAQADTRNHAMAVEWLDVTLTGADRAAVALLEPRLSDAGRMRLLERRFPGAPMSPRELLVELVEDRDGIWRQPWLRACALYAGRDELELVDAAADGGIVAETHTALLRRRAEVEAMAVGNRQLLPRERSQEGQMSAPAGDAPR